MSKPTVLDPPHNPIDIDPGVAYPYVIPTSGETSIAYFPTTDFDLALSGRTLTVTYRGLAYGVTLTVTVFCSNADGTISHQINFRIGAAANSVNPTVNIGVGTGQIAWNFDCQSNDLSTVGSLDAQPFNARLHAGWKFNVGALITGTSDGAIENQDLFCKLILNDTQFRASSSSGGAAIGPAHDGLYPATIHTMVNTSDLVYLGPDIVAKLALNQPIKLAYSDGTAMPTGFTGQMYVKEIVDASFVKLSATVGGAALVAGADSYASDPTVRILVDISGHVFPAITSAGELSVAPSGSVAYTITADIAVDRFLVEGLPDGLALAGTDIIGTPTESGFFPITLIAEKDVNVSYRYFLLSVGLGGLGLAVVDPDGVLDLGTGRFYTPLGPSGRAGDTMDVSLGDPPKLWKFLMNGVDFVFPDASEFGLVVSPQNDFNPAHVLLAGNFNVVGSAVQISAGEDWAAAALVALFDAATKQKNFTLWARWRFATDPATYYKKSFPVLCRVSNSSFVVGSPAIATPLGREYYLPQITRLTGGVLATDLDAQPMAGFGDRSLFREVTDLEGETVWRKELWEGADDPVTDTVAGRIVPVDYDNAINRYVLIQK